mmetsp:Transcript_25439/g.71464  ORF Transcript_25439/g.71464 Transcript_25439/m.71464 type:complete len:261 (-) Transcript_25439:3904-4686(-)
MSDWREPAASHSAEKLESASASNVDGAAYSRSLPSSRTATASQAAIVPSRCAIVILVAPPRAPPLSTRCTRRSVFWSTFAVASSMSTSLDFRAIARARHSNCLSPTDKLAPNSLSSKSKANEATRLAGTSPATSVAPSDSEARDVSEPDGARPPPRASSSAASSSSSVRSPNMSRLKRIVPANRVGACGTMATRPRSVFSPTLATSTPSTRTAPLCTGYRRRIVCTSVDLPAPVRPTTPTLDPASIVNVRPRRAGSGCRG